MAHSAPSGHRVEEQPHAPEVDLQFVPGLSVCHPDRGAATPTRSTQLRAEALEGADGDRDALTDEKAVDLHHGQVLVFYPGPDLLLVRLEPPPRSPVSVGSVRPDPFHHQGHEDVAELVFTASAIEPCLNRCRHVTADGLAVDPRQSFDCPQSLAPQPQPEHFSHLEHTHLPEGHRRSLVR